MNIFEVRFKLFINSFFPERKENPGRTKARKQEHRQQMLW